MNSRLKILKNNKKLKKEVKRRNLNKKLTNKRIKLTLLHQLHQESNLEK